MKLTFTAPELAWLNHYINQLIIVAANTKQHAVMRTAAKMRHKFYGNPIYVNLNQSERLLLSQVVEYREEMLGRMHLTSDEFALLTELSKKL